MANKANSDDVPRNSLPMPVATQGQGFSVFMSPQDRRLLKRREVILQAGMQFRKCGFHETSMDDVASALGVTKAALYRYVKDKNELLFECHLVAMDLGDAALEYGRRNGKTGLEKAMMTLEYFVSGYISTNAAGAAIVNIDALMPEHRKQIVQRRDQFDHSLRELIREGIDDQSVEPCDPRIASFAIMGAINWLPRWYRPEGEMTGEEVSRKMIEFFAHGLRKNRVRRTQRGHK